MSNTSPESSVPPARSSGGGADAGQSREMTFEEAARELEQIVQQLESGQADLDDAIRLWERGEQLHRLCVEKLDSAQGKIDVLRPVEPA